MKSGDTEADQMLWFAQIMRVPKVLWPWPLWHRAYWWRRPLSDWLTSNLTIHVPASVFKVHVGQKKTTSQQQTCVVFSNW